jgi:hypothetical protein
MPHALVLELVIRFRSQGMQWPLRAGDTIEIRQFGNPIAVATIQADMVIELVLHKLRDLEMLDAMKHGTPLRKSLARMDAERPALDIKAQRRRARRSRRAGA